MCVCVCVKDEGAQSFGSVVFWIFYSLIDGPNRCLCVLSHLAAFSLSFYRYLTVCSFLERNAASNCSNSETAGEDGWVAHIVLDCICGKEEHAIHMRKPGYVQQFRLGRRCRFLRLGVNSARCAPKALSQRSPVPLHIPLGSLIPPRSVDPMLLRQTMTVDLISFFCCEQASGHAARTPAGPGSLHANGPDEALLHRPFQEELDQICRAFAGGGFSSFVLFLSSAEFAPFQVLGMTAQMGGGGPPSAGGSSSSSSRAPGEAAAAVASQIWARAHTLPVMLLHDSIPCLKRPKKFPVQARGEGLTPTVGQVGLEIHPFLWFYSLT